MWYLKARRQAGGVTLRYDKINFREKTYFIGKKNIRSLLFFSHLPFCVRI